MSGVELIAAALAAGAGAGLTDTMSAGIRDAYDGLKGLIGRRIEGRDEAQQALEADEVNAGVWEARLGETLVDSGAAEDHEVLAAAGRLLALADPARATELHIAVGTNYGAVGSFNAAVTFNQSAPLPPSGPEA